MKGVVCSHRQSCGCCAQPGSQMSLVLWQCSLRFPNLCKFNKRISEIHQSILSYSGILSVTDCKGDYFPVISKALAEAWKVSFLLKGFTTLSFVLLYLYPCIILSSSQRKSLHFSPCLAKLLASTLREKNLRMTLGVTYGKDLHANRSHLNNFLSMVLVTFLLP